MSQRPPERIVSLCPSITETLFALGAGPRVVGRTRYCIHPANRVAPIPTVGGTKTVDLSRVEALRPDLVVAVQEENSESQIRALAQRHEVLLLDPVDIPTALQDILRLGARVGSTASAVGLVHEITAAFEAVPRAADIPVVYLIWRKPLMAVGAGTYIDALLVRLGLINQASGLPSRYPTLDRAAIGRLSPRLVLASTEPFPFAENHLAELRATFPGACPVRVDGEMFSWHGARMKLAARYFGELVPRLTARGGQLGVPRPAPESARNGRA